MKDIDPRSSRTRRSLGGTTSLIGAAHFVAPRIFDPFNRLGFPNNVRTFTYVNGAVETVIGVLLLRPGARRPSTVVSACYISYLAVCIVATHLRHWRGDGRSIQ